MRTVRILVTVLLIASVSTPALADDLRSSIAKAAEQQAESSSKPMPKAYLWAGSALFVGGMTVGIYAFLNNRNGSVPGLDECCATNKPLGAAGLGLAFAGGTILFLGQRQASKSASLTFGPGRLTLSKQVTW
jgi:hypothetical protein